MILPLLLLSCTFPLPPPQDAAAALPAKHFTDASQSYGVLVVDDPGLFAVGMGSGAAWFDYDGDGDDDLFAVRAAGGNQLFRNDGTFFVDVSDGAGIETIGPRDPLGASAADFDGDGRTDLYVTTSRENMLLRNLGGGHFTDRAFAEKVTGGQVFSTAASWADFDRDGDLELYVGNYITVLSFPYHTGGANLLFVNGNAPGLRFHEHAAELGVANTGVFAPTVPGYPWVSPEGQPTAGLTLSVATLDYDEDGYPDLQVGNDFGPWVLPNALYRNTTASGVLGFDDVTVATGFGIHPHYDMGINAADLDHDGDWDFYCSSLGDNVLLRNDGGVFSDVATEMGVAHGLDRKTGLFLTTWATVWQDLDNDGWEDLFLVNGHVPTDPIIANSVREPNALYWNVLGKSFLLEPDGTSGLADDGVGRGVAAYDVNRDGLMDLFTTNSCPSSLALPRDASRLWINCGAGSEGNHWLTARLAGRYSNGAGIGARVSARVGETTLMRQVLADTVYLASSSKEVHFGLGPAEIVDRLTVRWPSGLEQNWIAVTPDQHLVLREPAVTLGPVVTVHVTGALVHLKATAVNHDGTPLIGQATVLARTCGGALQALQTKDVVFLPGSGKVSATLDWKALPPGAVEVCLRVTADGSSDEEVASLALP